MAREKNLYVEYWETYLEDFIEIIKDGENIYGASVDFEGLKSCGDRTNYGFRLEIKNGQVSNNIDGSAVARDLYDVLSSKSFFMSLARNKKIVFKLSSKGLLDVEFLGTDSQASDSL